MECLKWELVLHSFEWGENFGTWPQVRNSTGIPVVSAFAESWISWRLLPSLVIASRTSSKLPWNMIDEVECRERYEGDTAGSALDTMDLYKDTWRHSHRPCCGNSSLECRKSTSMTIRIWLATSNEVLLVWKYLETPYGVDAIGVIDIELYFCLSADQEWNQKGRLQPSYNA